MNLSFETLEAYEEYCNSPKTYQKIMQTKCSCGNFRELVFLPLLVNIETCCIEINNCPMMKCHQCEDEQICPNMLQEIFTSYVRLQKADKKFCRMTMKSDLKYQYAKDAGYKYDSRDLFIPGLSIDIDPTHTEGFSCPVYFDRRVLNCFYSDHDYELDIFSESYGKIAKKGSNGWQYEWLIPFGIDRNNSVLIFLGDLDQIDCNDRATLWLKSYNIDSDHLLVNTEFYQAQFNCIFSEPIIEKRIIAMRNLFFSKIRQKYGIELFHLVDEVEAFANRIRKPINYTEAELRENMIALDGLLNEGISTDGLNLLFQKLVVPLPKNYIDIKTQTRKLLQGILGTVAGENDAAKLMTPQYVINDLRICFVHLLPQEKIEMRKQNVLRALQITNFDDHKSIYDTTINMLYHLYQYLNFNDI